MIHDILKNKPTKLFLGMTAFFCCNALIAESIGTKIFSLEKLFGFQPVSFTLFGQTGLSFNLTCGVLLWPLEFIMTDIVNEYYGPRAVRRISYSAVALIAYAFLMYYMAMGVPASDFWFSTGVKNGVPNMSNAFNAIFGQGMWIIFASITAFLVSQIVDVTIFHRIKKVTGEKRVWLRATGSTLVSQLVDSFIVLFIAFKIGQGWSWQLVLGICIMNYIYKATMALILTPVIYLVESRIEKYLGHDVAMRMKKAAMGQKEEVFTNIPAAG
jgi:queuosine precursor transporter